MNLIKKFILIFIISLEGFISISQVNNNTENEKLNYSIYLANEYLNCNSNIEKTINILNRSSILIEMNREKEALKLLEEIIYFKLNDSLMFIAYKQSALTSYILKKYTVTEKYLQLIDNYTNHFIDNSILKISVLTYNELNMYSKSKKSFLDLVRKMKSDSLDLYTNKVNELYKNIPVLKDPDKAMKLSSIFPGLGQFYAGRPIKGLISTAFVGFSFITGIYALKEKYFFSSIIFYNLGVKFYNGGKKSSYYFAGKKNYHNKNKFSLSIKNFFLKYKL